MPAAIETDGTDRTRDLDGLRPAFDEPVYARRVGVGVAEQAIEGGLADAEVDGVNGVRIGENAADLTVGGGADVVGDEGGGWREGGGDVVVGGDGGEENSS